MKAGPSGSFGEHLRALREAAGYTQEELATIAGLSVHGISALERGERRRPHVETVRALCAALDLTGATRDALLRSARAPAGHAAADELSGVSLPLPLTALLGRDADLQTLRQWLAQPAIRLITITGPGGVGKTRLALELAREIAADDATRVAFVPLTVTRSPAAVAAAIAESLGVSDVTAGDLPGRIRVACNGQATLLILDNFEQVLEAATLVVELLSSAGSLRLLVTSRAALRVRGEREYVLGPLALDSALDETSPAALVRSPAVRLFVERVRDVQPDFRLTAANGPTIAAICRRLDALPLAIELAAPWMKVLTADNLLERLAQDVLPPTDGPRDLPERQQTMNATVAWSYQLLNPEEQRAFRHFGALPGLFPIDAAAAVLAGRDAGSPEHDEERALAAVACLIDRSLLVGGVTSVVASCPLYYMLETVRAYAAQALAAAGERDAAMEGLVRYCSAEAALAAEGLVGPAQVEWLDRVREDLQSYRAALTWLAERGRGSDMCRIAARLMFFWQIRGHAAEGLSWYEQALTLPLSSAADESTALLGVAVMCYTQGEHERARAAGTRTIALAATVEKGDVVANAEHLLGHVEYAVGNFDEARRRFTRSLTAFRERSISWGMGFSLSGMAEVALATGDAETAERLVDEATTVLMEVGPWFLSLGLYIRAIIAVRRDDADRAIATVRDSLTNIRALHDRFAFVYTLVPLAVAAALKGEDAWAARILGTRDAVIESSGAALIDTAANDLLRRAEEIGRARLGPDGWAAAYAAGRVTSIDALLKEIDRIVPKPSGLHHEVPPV